MDLHSLSKREREMFFALSPADKADINAIARDRGVAWAVVVMVGIWRKFYGG